MLSLAIGHLMIQQLLKVLNYFTSLYGMKKVITEPTHISESSASCIDLVFINQPNIVMDSGVHLTLQEKCYHQIIFSKLKN